MNFFNIDGVWHNSSMDCCAFWSDMCRKCGNKLHRQPVYGSIIDVCAVCEPPETIGAEDGSTDEELDKIVGYSKA